MRIGLANDHRGYEKKQFITNFLKDMGYSVINYGTDSNESVDFPDYAKKLGKALQNKEVDLGIAICGTGIGMSIALNKMINIYCAKVSTPSEATLAKAHNDANAMAISEEMDDETTKQVIENFIETPFSNVKKYVNRNKKIREINND